MCVYMYIYTHIGYLCCFCSLGTVSGAATNISVQTSLYILTYTPSDICPGAETANYSLLHRTIPPSMDYLAQSINREAMISILGLIRQVKTWDLSSVIHLLGAISLGMRATGFPSLALLSCSRIPRL
jgi:hypothetical protein